MRGFIFTIEVFLAIVITSIFLSLVDVEYITKTGLELHKIVEDFLAILKIENKLQTLDADQIQEILNKTTKKHHLEIYRYYKDNLLESVTVIGETIEEEAAVAKSTFVDDEYFYLAVLAVWK